MLRPALWATENWDDTYPLTVRAPALYRKGYQRDAVGQPKYAEKHVKHDHAYGDDRKQNYGEHDRPYGTEHVCAEPSDEIEDIRPDLDVPLPDMFPPEICPPISNIRNGLVLVLESIVYRDSNLMIAGAEEIVSLDTSGYPVLVHIRRIWVFMQQKGLYKTAT